MMWEVPMEMMREKIFQLFSPKVLRIITGDVEYRRSSDQRGVGGGRTIFGQT